MSVSKMQGSCRCQAGQATTRHLAVKKIPRSLKIITTQKAFLIKIVAYQVNMPDIKIYGSSPKELV
jgi:hypothetical protein